jgi:hypothetical protein
LEKLVDILKVIMEKHLIQSVIALAGAICTVAIFPKNHYIIIRIGDLWFGILLFCVNFIIIQGIIKIYKMISKVIYVREEKIYEKNRIAERNKIAVQELWSLVDGMEQHDYEYLITFIKNGNSPITKPEVYGDCLFNSDYVNVTSLKEATEKPCVINNCSNIKNDTIKFSVERVMFTPATKQYKLKDDFFSLLKYSYEEYGRISNFFKEKQING